MSLLSFELWNKHLLKARFQRGTAKSGWCEPPPIWLLICSSFSMENAPLLLAHRQATAQNIDQMIKLKEPKIHHDDIISQFQSGTKLPSIPRTKKYSSNLLRGSLEFIQVQKCCLFSKSNMPQKFTTQKSSSLVWVLSTFDTSTICKFPHGKSPHFGVG